MADWCGDRQLTTLSIPSGFSLPKRRNRPSKLMSWSQELESRWQINDPEKSLISVT
jgi:hypothetical protein